MCVRGLSRRGFACEASAANQPNHTRAHQINQLMPSGREVSPKPPGVRINFLREISLSDGGLGGLPTIGGDCSFISSAPVFCQRTQDYIADCATESGTDFASESEVSAELIVFRSVFMSPFLRLLSKSFSCHWVLLCLAMGLASPARAVEAVAADGISRVDINRQVGATTFYNAGITGQGAQVANVEGSHYAAEYLGLANQAGRGGVRYTSREAAGEESGHPTACSMIIAGNDYIDSSTGEYHFSRGIAHGATLSSGAIATSTIAGGRFSIEPYTLYPTYEYFFGRVDVISSSWGAAIEDPYGYAFGLDALAQRNSKTTFVAAVGNEGAKGTNTVGWPGRNFNAIGVGALNNTFTGRADYSSYGPTLLTMRLSDGSQKTLQRATVDIVAPGTNVMGPNSANHFYSDYYMRISGTSFATPIVAGGATLLASLSREKEKAGASADIGGQWKAMGARSAGQVGEDSRDSRVIKAVLLNSADKLAGWTNNASLQAVQGHDGSGALKLFADVWTTRQALDWQLGAGALNLDKAFRQYVSQQWRLDSVGVGEMMVYDIGAWEAGEFVTTLTWFADAFLPDGYLVYDEAGLSALANLDLEVWTLKANGELDTLLAVSRTECDTVEHISLTLSSITSLALRVVHQGGLEMVKNYTWGAETFALAWDGIVAAAAVPEAGTCALVFGGVVLVFGLRRISRRRF